jgi:hypothetical protein
VGDFSCTLASGQTIICQIRLKKLGSPDPYVEDINKLCGLRGLNRKTGLYRYGNL